MFHKVITDGDLMLTYKPPYPFGKHEPYRNLSGEVRELEKLRNKARAKYLELSRLHVIAKTNVGEELETLQYHLFHNSYQVLRHYCHPNSNHPRRQVGPDGKWISRQEAPGGREDGETPRLH